MRIINIFATERGLISDTCYAGGCGEDKKTALVIHLGGRLTEEYDYYLRFCTSEQAARGGMSVTEKLGKENGIIIFTLPACLMRAGVLRIQLLAVRENETVFSPTLKGGLEIVCTVKESMGSDWAKGLISFYDMAEYAACRRKAGKFLCGSSI